MSSNKFLEGNNGFKLSGEYLDILKIIFAATTEL